MSKTTSTTTSECIKKCPTNPNKNPIEQLLEDLLSKICSEEEDEERSEASDDVTVVIKDVLRDIVERVAKECCVRDEVTCSSKLSSVNGESCTTSSKQPIVDGQRDHSGSQSNKNDIINPNSKHILKSRNVNLQPVVTTAVMLSKDNKNLQKNDRSTNKPTCSKPSKIQAPVSINDTPTKIKNTYLTQECSVSNADAFQERSSQPIVPMRKVGIDNNDTSELQNTHMTLKEDSKIDFSSTTVATNKCNIKLSYNPKCAEVASEKETEKERKETFGRVIHKNNKDSFDNDDVRFLINDLITSVEENIGKSNNNERKLITDTAKVQRPRGDSVQQSDSDIVRDCLEKLINDVIHNVECKPNKYKGSTKRKLQNSSMLSSSVKRLRTENTRDNLIEQIKLRPILNRTFESTADREAYESVAEKCLEAFGFCCRRFPEHYKSQYTMAFFLAHSTLFKVCLHHVFLFIPYMYSYIRDVGL